MQHFHRCGPRGTYLGTSCSKKLRSGEVAKLCYGYVLPKFQLRFAEERPADMAACVRLALAETPLQVQEACFHPSTGTYDLMRHIYLRQSFVTVWVTEQKHCIDCHKDYMTFGGFTEHTLFVSGLVQERDFLSPICSGPLHSRARRQPKRKAKPKRSERTKAMLGPPQAQQQSVGYSGGRLNEVKVVSLISLSSCLDCPASSKADVLETIFPPCLLYLFPCSLVSIGFRVFFLWVQQSQVRRSRIIIF